MLTQSFIEKVHNAFDELNYHETKCLDSEQFCKAAAKTIAHCKELSDAVCAVSMFQFCVKKWSKIERLFERKLQVFNEIKYEGNTLISLVPTDDAIGTYYITNGVYRKAKKLFVATALFPEQIFSSSFENGCFRFFEEGKYYIKYSKMSLKMKLFDNNDECLCNINLSNNFYILLENNITSYEIIVYEDCVGIYKKSYIDSLNDIDDAELDYLIADIEWDALEKNSELGVAKLNVYEPEQDVELFMLFASSILLLFHRYMDERKAMAYFVMNHYNQ